MKYLVWSFAIGAMVFIIPAYMVVGDRTPCVETTDFHTEPYSVKPGQKFTAVWTDKALRNCDGVVNRRFIDMNGVDVWVFSPVHTVHHGPPGSINRFHTPWVAPDIPSGMELVLRKDIRRWGNPIQKWVWPMAESQEAPFWVIGSDREGR